MLTLHRNRWTDSSKKKKRKKETHWRKPIWNLLKWQERYTFNPASSQWRWWVCCFLSHFSLSGLMFETDLEGGTKFFFPVCSWTFFWPPPQFVSRDLLKMLCLWTGSRDTCGTQLAKSPTKENFLSQTQRRRQKNVSGASCSAATWQTMVPVLGLTQASVLK